MPLAVVENAPGAVVERFGKQNGVLFYTVRNPGYSAPKAVLRIRRDNTLSQPGLSSLERFVVVDELSGKRLEAAIQGEDLVVQLPLGLDDVRVISVNREGVLQMRAFNKAKRILEDRTVTRKFEKQRGERLAEG